MRQKYFPEILFLMETKHCRNVLVDIQEWLGYYRVYTVDPIGLSDVLALFWKKSVMVDFQFIDKHLMDFHAHFGSFNSFVSQFGAPIVKMCNHVWEMLMRIGL